MTAMGVIPSLDEVEDGRARLDVGAEAVAVEELALEGVEEALAHRIVIAVADRSHGGPHAGLAATGSEGDRGIL